MARKDCKGEFFLYIEYNSLAFYEMSYFRVVCYCIFSDILKKEAKKSFIKK